MHINGTITFDPSDNIYADHFPGNPVVPGSLIVHAFMEAVTRADLERNICRIKNFRFSEFVRPGTYSFSIRAFEDRLKCRLFSRNDSDAEKIFATGTIIKCT